MPRKRWSRYAPPRDPLTEDGSRASQPTARPTARSTAPPTARSAGPGRKAPGRKTPAPTSTKLVWAGLGVAAVLVGGVVVGVVTSSEDEPVDDVDTSLLDPVVIAETLERAEAEITVGSPTAFRLSDYYLEVEFYDRTAQEVRTFRQDTFGDGFSIDVRPNEYPDYAPRPIELDDLDPAVVVDLTEDAIERVAGARSFSLRTEVERGDGELQLVVEARSDDYDDTVTLTADAAGRVVEETVG